jgi:hypothetical protein
VRGAIKVKCHLMFGILVLAVDQIFRLEAFKPAPASSSGGKITRSMNFARGSPMMSVIYVAHDPHHNRIRTQRRQDLAKGCRVRFPDASSGRPNASRNSFLITASQKPFVTAGAKVKNFGAPVCKNSAQCRKCLCRKLFFAVFDYCGVRQCNRASQKARRPQLMWIAETPGDFAQSSDVRVRKISRMKASRRFVQ